MLKLAVAPLFLATLVLAGCGTSHQSASSSSTAASSAEGAAATAAPAATAVTGTVTVPNPPTLITPQAKLTLSLVDVTRQPSATINTQDFSPPQFPQAFRIPFSASAINPRDLYVLQATMQDGGRTYSTKLQHPVLTNGQPARVDLTLVAEPTAAERMLADFATAKRQTGGMKVKSGTSAKIGESHSWQVFRNDRGVQFIIEQANQDEKGFTKTEYAYREGLPWVVVQEQMPKPNAPATTTEKVGWGNEGALVLNQKITDGKTEQLSDATAKSLHDEAEAQYKRFSKNG
ncbi:MAG: YbaY family lipoprotein [Rhodanobacteraceae bacterium]